MTEEDPIKAIEAKAQHYLQRIRKAEDLGISEIQTLFHGSVIFITGGTGFVGKQLVEKLLRSCRGIQKVYLLIRSKKGKTIAERLERQWKDPVYDELRSIDPQFTKRVFPIQGDVGELSLGINESVWSRVKDEINFIFHIAATVKFNEPLKRAVMINVRGTKELLSMANGVPNLKALVHVSSCYANCNRSEVHEVFYDVPIQPDILVDLAAKMDEAKFEAVGKILMEGWPNTYTFSKAVAENLVKTARDLPVCVLRPGIITAAFYEPVMGWLDKSAMYGPSGIILGVGLGVMHILNASWDCNFDLVPMDFVNNLAITAAWDTAKRAESNERDCKIYTCSRKRNPLLSRDLYHFMLTPARKLVSTKAIWYCFCHITESKLVFLLNTIFLHFIPALIVDAALTSTGHKPRLSNVYSKVYTMNSVLAHFICRSWVFHDDNTVEVRKKMTKIDQEIYPFEIAEIDLKEYMTAWCIGVRKFIMKDTLEDTNVAIKRQKWLRVANYVFMLFYGFVIWYILKGLFDIVSMIVIVFLSSL